MSPERAEERFSYQRLTPLQGFGDDGLPTQGYAKIAPPWANMCRPFRPEDPYATPSLRVRLLPLQARATRLKAAFACAMLFLTFSVASRL